MRTRLLAAGSPLSEERHGPTRREILSLIAKGALASSILGPNLFSIGPEIQSAGQQAFPAEWELTDASLLEEIVSRAVLFFWNEASPRTGLVRDRALADGAPRPEAHGEHRSHRIWSRRTLHRTPAPVHSFPGNLPAGHRDAELSAESCRAG